MNKIRREFTNQLGFGTTRVIQEPGVYEPKPPILNDAYADRRAPDQALIERFSSIPVGMVFNVHDNNVRGNEYVGDLDDTLFPRGKHPVKRFSPDQGLLPIAPFEIIEQICPIAVDPPDGLAHEILDESFCGDSGFLIITDEHKVTRTSLPGEAEEGNPMNDRPRIRGTLLPLVVFPPVMLRDIPDKSQHHSDSVMGNDPVALLDGEDGTIFFPAADPDKHPVGRVGLINEIRESVRSLFRRQISEAEREHLRLRIAFA